MISATSFDRHGQIRCGTISVANIKASTALYRDYLHQQVVEEGRIDATQTATLNMPAALNARYVVFQPKSEVPSFLRLIEVPIANSYPPARTLGWNAFEISVRDVFSLEVELEDSDFDVIGPPKLVDGFTSFIPMQVVGPDGEVLFLNQVNHSDDATDLPLAQCEVDQFFIAVVASPNRETSVQEYVKSLNLDRGTTHQLRYSLINRAFDLPDDTQQTITLIQNKRLPFAQIDQYPENYEIRPQQQDGLPAGNSMVSVMVKNIDELPITDRVIGPAKHLGGVIYQGRKTQVIRGSASELIELIEIG